MMLERRLVGGLWLGALVEAGYAVNRSESYSESANANGGTHSGESSHVGGGLQLRYVTTPDWIVALSLFATVNAGYSHSSHTSEYGGYGSSSLESRSFGIGAQLGLALEREIVPGFGMRLSSAIVHLTYSDGDTETESSAQVDTYESSNWSGGLAFTPTLAFVFRF